MARKVKKKKAVARATRRPVPNRRRHWAVRTALSSSAFVGGLFVFLVLINLYDPDVDPAALAALRIAPATIPEADNAYYAQIGLGVAASESPHRYGVRAMAARHAWGEMHPGIPESRSEEITALDKENETLRWKGNIKFSCAEPRTDCLSVYAKYRTDIQQLRRDNRVRLARYRALYRYAGFQEVPTNVFLGGPASSPYNERNVTLALIALTAIDGDPAGAVHALAVDSAYWRRVVAGAQCIITKMIGVAYLDQNYALLAEITSRYHGQSDILAAAQPMAKPLTVAELDWTPAFNGESRMLASFILNMLASDKDAREYYKAEHTSFWESAVQALFFKPRATVNLHCRITADLLPIATARADALKAVTESARDSVSDLTGVFSFGMVYNPVGKMLVSIGSDMAPMYAKYVARAHNLDGRMRLLILQRDLYRRGVATDNVEKYLATTDVSLYDPYRNQPMRWDASAHEIWFNGIPRNYEALDPGLRIAVRF